MTGGPACFGILTTKKEYATWLPHKLNLMVVRFATLLAIRRGIFCTWTLADEQTLFTPLSLQPRLAASNPSLSTASSLM